MCEYQPPPSGLIERIAQLRNGSMVATTAQRGDSGVEVDAHPLVVIAPAVVLTHLSKHLALSRYLLSFYPGTPGGEGP